MHSIFLSIETTWSHPLELNSNAIFPVPEKRSMLYKYKFLPQEFKLRDKDPVIDVSTMESAGQIFKIYHDQNILTLKSSEPLPKKFSIAPTPVITTRLI